MSIIGPTRSIYAHIETFSLVLLQQYYQNYYSESERRVFVTHFVAACFVDDTAIMAK